jgi:hypothetical protein
MPGVDDEESRTTAEQMEQENPRWIVVFGVFTKEFFCLPRFKAPRGTLVVALYPGAALTRMREIENRLAPKRGESGQ